MFKKVPFKNKGRFRIITFAILPLCFAAGFFLSIRIALLLGYKVDSEGKVIVALSFIPLYVWGALIVNRKLRQKAKTEEN